MKSRHAPTASSLPRALRLAAALGLVAPVPASAQPRAPAAPWLREPAAPDATAAEAATNAPRNDAPAGAPAVPPPPPDTPSVAVEPGDPREALYAPGALLQPREGTVPVRLESDGAPLRVSVRVGLPYRTRVLVAAEPAGYLGGFAGGPFGAPFGAGFGGGFGGGLFGAGGFGAGVPLGPAYVEREVQQTAQPELCHTPCTLHLRPGEHALRLGGAGGLRETEELLAVSTAEGPRRFVFRAASQARFSAAQGLLWAGAALLTVGSLLALHNAGIGCAPGALCDYTWAGLTLGAGGALALAGLPLFFGARAGLARPPEPFAP